MDMMKQIEKMGIVPVVVIEDAKQALPLAEALCAGGLPCAEVTFRTAAARDAIREMKKKENMLVGAGTVLTTDQVDEAVDAGAEFIVSPGFNRKVVRHCREKGIPVIPGVCTPTEVEMALEEGLEVVKFFPAEAAGGIAMIKAMSAPYGNVRFMPTGGITMENLADYLSCNKVIACGGSFMVSKKLIAENQFEKIEELTREAVSLCKKIRG
ncbi:MAG: bifunctional 4-hydroxy-2-oxoglutarate aldolase/2-dehydro-3-deoxy-phosphogluconate aldolase [Lachnospiraceae bacterium]